MAITTAIVVSIFGVVIYRKKKKEKKEKVSTWKQNSEGEIKNDLE